VFIAYLKVFYQGGFTPGALGFRASPGSVELSSSAKILQTSGLPFFFRSAIPLSLPQDYLCVSADILQIF
jgi:hypothetical protein